MNRSPRLGPPPPRDPPYDYVVCTPQSDRSEWRPGVRAFHDYWLALGEPGRLPGRQHFDPLDIPKLLPNIWIREVHRDPIRFRARLIGTAIVAALGVDLTGKWLHEEHKLSSSYDRVVARFEKAVREGVATYSNSSLILYSRQEHLRIENVTVPLAQDGRTVDMLVGYSWMSYRSGAEL